MLSGHIGTGKSTLARLLKEEYKLVHISTSTLLKQAATASRLALERRVLQELGERLDRKTKGLWVVDELRKTIDNLITSENPTPRIVLDSVRIQPQIDAIRAAYGQAVLHVHLTTNPEELGERYAKRIAENKNTVKELATYAEAAANKTERNVDKLEADADVVISTDRSRPEDVAIRVACHLGLHGRQYERCIDVIVGGQYGSEGKGHIAAHIAREYQLLVRVGGPNAGHTVFLNPEPYTFHHLPSGSLHSSEVPLVLGPGASLNVPKLLEEIARCECDAKRLSIDPMAIIITDEDREEELKSLRKSISSTAQGVGRAAIRRIHRDPKTIFAKDVQVLRPYVRPAQAVYESVFRAGGRVLLEGTQGTALSLFHGAYPFVTSRDTTVSGCLSEAGMAPSRLSKVIMVCRTYPIRVQNPKKGSSGPMSQEITLEEIARRSGLPLKQLKATEITSTTKRKRRIAEFDWSLLRRSSALNGPTDIALTFVDYLDATNQQARRFEQLSPKTIRFIEDVEKVSCAPVTLISTRFNLRSIIDRRAW